MIDRVRFWVVPYLEPNDHGSTRYSVFVELTDSSGATGWGEAVTIFEEAARSTATLLESWSQLLMGARPHPPAIRELLLDRAWWYSGGGASAFALAAIDVAAWDLTGRIQNTTVVDLLVRGAPAATPHSSLPIIMTTHASMGDLDKQAELLAEGVATLSAGGVKVGWGKLGDARLGFEAPRDELFASRLRAALPEQSLMMFDIGARIKWTPEEAVARVRSFEPHGLHWIEEPLGADDPHGYALLRDSTSVLIAYGEREWTANGIRRILSTGSVDVVGIDAGRAEGITGFVDAVRSIEAAGKQANAHAFAGPLSYAAGLAVSLTSASCRQFEVAPLRNQLMSELAPELPVPRAIVGPLPGVGLGVEIDSAAVDRLSLLAAG